VVRNRVLQNVTAPMRSVRGMVLHPALYSIDRVQDGRKQFTFFGSTISPCVSNRAVQDNLVPAEDRT